MKWNPIETAPKDGTSILLYVPGYGSREGWWVLKSFTGKQHWAYVSYPSDGCGCCSDDDPEPTKWIALPTEE